MPKARRTTSTRSRRPSPGSRSGDKLAAIVIELEHTTTLCRRHSEELAIQFKRIAQLQAELDEVKKLLQPNSR